MCKQNFKRYAWVLWINVFISAFTFGGGYVVVPMIRKYFVQKKQLFTEEELTSMAAIAQSSPGAIAINLSVLAGYRTAGTAGAILSCVGAVIPPIVILSVVSVWYTAFSSNLLIAAILKGMQAGVAALIVDLVADMCKMILKEHSLLLTCMIPGAFIASFLFHANVALILLVCCLLCILRIFYQERKARLC